jgi:hypothetical protein
VPHGDPDTEPTQLAVAEASLVKSERVLAAERILELENRMLADSLEIVADVHRFREISPDDTAPPQAWIDELGEELAWRRFRVASAAWLPVKEAPVAIKTATQMAVGILKVKAMDRSGGRMHQFNAAVVVNLSGEQMQPYPRKVVDK